MEVGLVSVHAKRHRGPQLGFDPTEDDGPLSIDPLGSKTHVGVLAGGLQLVHYA